jgi:hypothetical protein
VRYGKRVEVSSSLGPSSTEPYSQSKGIGISTHSGELGQKKLLALLPLDMTLLSVDVQCARDLAVVCLGCSKHLCNLSLLDINTAGGVRQTLPHTRCCRAFSAKS